MAKIGYIRCSTTDQNPARQEESLKNSRCEKVFSDMLSGKETFSIQMLRVDAR